MIKKSKFNRSEDCLILDIDSILFHHYWLYDDDSETGEYVMEDISNMSWNPNLFIDKPFYFQDGCTLRTLFDYLNINLKIWDIVVGNWLEEIVVEGLVDKPLGGEVDKLILLEVYQSIEKSELENDDFISGLNRWNFHGNGIDENGSPMNYALEFTPVYEIIDVPIHINDMVTISETKNNKYVLRDLGRHQPSLFEVVYGIIWELSFCGSPNDRNEKKKELDEMVKNIEKDIENGNLERIPIDDSIEGEK